MKEGWEKLGNLKEMEREETEGNREGKRSNRSRENGKIEGRRVRKLANLKEMDEKETEGSKEGRGK